MGLLVPSPIHFPETTLMLTRREAFQVTAGAAATLMIPAVAKAKTVQAAGFTLPALPYPVDALEPHIDARTMEIHHQRHHKAYVDNVNAALKDQPGWLGKPIGEVIKNLKDLPEGIRTAVRNNGGGHFNHTLFWNTMGKNGGQPSGELLKAIDKAFGGVMEMKAALKDAGMKRFGSGWSWLVPGGEKGLMVMSSPNQDNPLMDGMPAPILGVDVWEHAYYLKYQNKRADYIDAWFNVINWDAVAANYAGAKK